MPLARTYTSAIARNVQQGRVVCRILAISAHTPIRIRGGSAAGTRLPLDIESCVLQGKIACQVARSNSGWAAPSRLESKLALRPDHPRIQASKRRRCTKDPCV